MALILLLGVFLLIIEAEMLDVCLVLILNFFANGLLYLAVWNVLLQELGFSIGELSVFISVTFLTQTLCEMPSGWASDHWGARRTLTVGQLCLLASLIFFSLWPSLVTLIFLGVGTGVANALYSDTDTTLVYQRLCAKGQTHLYPRFLAFYNSLGFVGEGLAAVAGAGVAEFYGLSATLWLSVPLLLLHLLLTQFLAGKKPTRCRQKQKTSSIWHQGWQQMRCQPVIRSLMFYAVIVYALNMLVWYYYQNYAEIMDLPLFYFGILTIIFAVSEALPQYLTRFFISCQQTARLYVSVITLTCLCILVASWRIDALGLVYLFLSVMLTGFTFPLTDTWLRRGSRVQSWTGLVSFKTFAMILVFALYNVVFGALADTYSLAMALGVIGGVSLVLTWIFALSQRFWGRSSKTVSL